VYNLVNDIDAEATRARMEEYRRTHREEILVAQLRRERAPAPTDVVRAGPIAPDLTEVKSRERPGLGVKPVPLRESGLEQAGGMATAAGMRADAGEMRAAGFAPDFPQRKARAVARAALVLPSELRTGS
jgi:hypothetical protein